MSDSVSATGGPKRRATGKRKTGAGKKTTSASRTARKAAPGMARTASEAADQAATLPLGSKIWRGLAMVAFALIGYFGLLAILVLAGMQFVVLLINDGPNDELRRFMMRIAAYEKEIFDYLAFKREDMPFPFAEFPDGE